MATPPDFSPGQVLTAAHMDAVGLWKITPTSVTNGTIQTNGDATWTGQTSVSFNGVFTSGYINYRVILSGLTITTSNQDLHFRMRAAGTDQSAGTEYSSGGIAYDSFTTAFTQQSFNNNNFGYFSRLVSTRTTISADIYEPQLSVPSSYTWTSNLNNASSQIFRSGSGLHKLSTSYDGFTLFVPANTFAGRVSIYGYN
jgi:hypothetical protein